ncbi:radical SAM/SPASM domain Clo7bot peptide maturase [Clostridium sporogenes]|uniref:Radical SAM/SPASM domain Clo7bot peptide maturase n=2 Tax=Clostridium TaxID=1485 RepID=A0A6M0SWT2_CLOBO|nr:radical SAM/SPASM domain Clo7bot peptide maturase [Clostridium sporogenes]NFA59613.1 radical SAM/SPASM domain Clo7bot peptide maturase [Clostridium botulinum]MDS1002090.1 radical SAM/SPASM domain Clo7bot peptide maturase [Clostridium sporogenes]NFI73373.1 radical SAM/SPASM domain Clo7bot peptide maturase [Clostridium sporogenes]NFL72666.1 radical SAM/SPASM domain Clo7bot peptide maturase [Clostridium sporogenes]NFM23232.1 radical SAM/SPASM domain Clo7bot peptide maturase [Clostridium sporog
MKKSKYNKIIKLEDGKTIAFNSVTCALAEVDQDFLNVLENIENIDVENLDEKTKELVENMSEGNYIVHDEMDELKLLKYRNYNGKFSSSGLGLVIAPTLACNFACPYCYETPKAGLMDKKIQDSLIEMIEENAKRKHDISVTWYGGEPLLAKDMIFDFSQRAIEICEREGAKYSAYIVTNGYLIDEETIENMKKAKITGAQITVDGPPSIHNKRRILKNSDEETFTTIIANVKKLINGGIKNIAIRINVDKTNVDHVEELLDILEENELKDVVVNLGHVTAYTDTCNGIANSCLNTKEYAKNDTKYQKVLFERGYKVAGSYPFYPSIKANYCCADNVGAYVIDSEGYMYKCWNDVGNIDRAVGNVATIKEKVDEKMYARNMDYILWSPFEHEDCRQCEILPICMGGCPYKGSTNEKPECEKWIYSLEDTIIATYNQKNECACTGQGCCCD